jgi:hypothetical protein
LALNIGSRALIEVLLAAEQASPMRRQVDVSADFIRCGLLFSNTGRSLWPSSKFLRFHFTSNFSNDATRIFKKVVPTPIEAAFIVSALRVFTLSSLTSKVPFQRAAKYSISYEHQQFQL